CSGPEPVEPDRPRCRWRADRVRPTVTTYREHRLAGQLRRPTRMAFRRSRGQTVVERLVPVAALPDKGCCSWRLGRVVVAATQSVRWTMFPYPARAPRLAPVDR